MAARPVSGPRLEAIGELAVPGDGQLAHALRVRPILGLNSLVQDLQLGVLVLQHVLFARDACLELENRLLIAALRDGFEQLLRWAKRLLELASDSCDRLCS